jgi:copper homeostasis protein
MHATFHRAFDETRDLQEALESVIQTGADSLLTSGGAADVLSGAEMIGALQRQAGARIDIIAGGGLRLESLGETVRRSGVFSLHGSLSRRNGQLTPEERFRALEADVQHAVRLLRNAHGEVNAATTALKS